MKNKQSGFTLIEIAIVLVIIGLLLGGVLKGQEMINNGKIKRAINDVNGISAAYYSYLDRYAAFPGDDANAATRWAIANIEGDGLGSVDTGAWNTDGADEASRLWLHLRLSGLVAGQITDADPGGRTHPINSFGGIVGIEDENFLLTGSVVCLSGLESKFAEIIDFQLDDGDATTGSVRGHTAAVAAANTAYSNAAWVGIKGFVCYQL